MAWLAALLSSQSSASSHPRFTEVVHTHLAASPSSVGCQRICIFASRSDYSTCLCISCVPVTIKTKFIFDRCVVQPLWIDLPLVTVTWLLWRGPQLQPAWGTMVPSLELRCWTAAEKVLIEQRSIHAHKHLETHLRCRRVVWRAGLLRWTVRLTPTTKPALRTRSC